MKIEVLGGGPAGSAIAYFLSKKNILFNLYESSTELGGNAKTMRFDDFLYDTGAHRWHDKNIEMTDEIKNLLGNELKLVSAPSKIFWNNKFINFPISPFNIIKNLPFNTLSKIIIENINNKLKEKKKYSNFKLMAYQNYGKTLSDLFLINYTEKLWGTNSENLITEISGNRLKGLSMKNLLKELIIKQKVEKHLDGSFYYPKYGFGSIFKAIQNKIDNNSICLESSITSIYHSDNIIKAIKINNCELREVKGQIISTLPINSFINILSPNVPENIKTIANSIKYRGLLLTIIQLDKHKFSENASIYFPQKDIPFNRIYEPKSRSPKLAPPHQTCIVVETTLKQEDITKVDVDKFLNKIKKSLINLSLINENEILKSKIVKINHAYPIMDLKSKQRVEILKKYLNRFKNLEFVGRNALFKYTHTHNLFEDAKDLVKNITNPKNKLYQ